MICQECYGTGKTSLTPENVRPFPKVGPRHEHRGKIKAKSRNWSNIPEKNKTELEELEREMKNRGKRNKNQKKNEGRQRTLAAKKTTLSIFK
jgi:hypothetical protein